MNAVDVDPAASEPRFSVGEYTTRGLSFVEDLDLYARLGIDGIGIDAGLKLRGTDDELAAFEASGLRATFCFPTTPSVLPLPQLPGTTDPVERIDAMCRSIADLARYQPLACVCVTGPQGAYSSRQARDLAVRGLREAAQCAAEFGIDLAVEPMHASLRDEWSIVTTIPETVDLLEEVGEPNVRIMYDVWHLWDTKDLLAHTREYAPQLAGVQVNDWRSPTRSWCDRVLPGDGMADVRGIFAALDAGGYNGWFELEVFSDDGTFGNEFNDSLWKLDPETVVRRGHEAFLRLWNGRHDQLSEGTRR